MSRIVRRVVLFACAIFSIIACASAVRLFTVVQADRQISALRAGHDVSAGTMAPPDVLVARAQSALARGQVAAAQAIVDALGARDQQEAQAQVLYALGNYNLRGALGNFTQLPFRVIAPRIRLAKAEYRQAMQLDPQNWDARYNYTLAAALVRDTETVSPTAGAEMAHERAAWPDIPGAPNGMP